MLDTVTQDRIDALFASFTAPGSPGCAVGVMRGGQLVHGRGYGLANLEHGIPITPTTTFYIASVSKQFTAMAVALLANEGKLDLDADIHDYLPFVPDFGHRITAKHLLYHTSGLRSDIFLLIAAGYRMEDIITQEDLLRLVCRQRELDFLPGEEFSYCGTGYALLTEIVASVGGVPFAEYCWEQIFAPLGMSSTRFETDPLALISERAGTYFPVGEGEYKRTILTTGLVGGTGIYTTIDDLALWDANFYTGNVGGDSVLSMMQTPGTLNSGKELRYAFGLAIDSHRGRKVLSHAGAGSGVNCYMMRLPDERLTVAILGNSNAVRGPTLARSVADVLLNIEGEHAAAASASGRRQVIDLADAGLESRAGRYFNPTTGALIELPLRDGKLTLYGYELSAETEDAFFIPEHPEATVRFREAHGTTHATVDIGEGPTTYDRITPVVPASQELAEYAGTYYSPEVDTTWTIELDGDRLVVHRARQGISALVPLCKDVFTDPWAGALLHGTAQWVIAFDREGESISGLRVSATGGRGRNLRFDRKQEGFVARR